MKKYIVENTDNFIFYLNNDNNIYQVKLEFVDIDRPKKGDFLYINNKIFKEMQNTFMSFGPIEGIYGHDLDNLREEETIIIEKDNKKIYLKRFYG